MTKGTRSVPLPVGWRANTCGEWQRARAMCPYLWDGVPIRVGSDKGHAAACPYMWDAFLLRVDQAIDLRGEFLHHVAGDAVGLADLLVHIHAGTPDACLGGDIQSPQAKTLHPAALPLEIIHQAPVEIALDLVIMGDHVP